jgi:hypothetical protein
VAHPHAAPVAMVDEMLDELEVAAAEQTEDRAVAEPRERLRHRLMDAWPAQRVCAPSQIISSTGNVSSMTPYFCV